MAIFFRFSLHFFFFFFVFIQPNINSAWIFTSIQCDLFSWNTKCIDVFLFGCVGVSFKWWKKSQQQHILLIFKHLDENDDHYFVYFCWNFERIRVLFGVHFMCFENQIFSLIFPVWEKSHDVNKIQLCIQEQKKQYHWTIFIFHHRSVCRSSIFFYVVWSILNFYVQMITMILKLLLPVKCDDDPAINLYVCHQIMKHDFVPKMKKTQRNTFNSLCKNK